MFQPRALPAEIRQGCDRRPCGSPANAGATDQRDRSVDALIQSDGSVAPLVPSTGWAELRRLCRASS